MQWRRDAFTSHNPVRHRQSPSPQSIFFTNGNQARQNTLPSRLYTVCSIVAAFIRAGPRWTLLTFSLNLETVPKIERFTIDRKRLRPHNTFLLGYSVGIEEHIKGRVAVASHASCNLVKVHSSLDWFFCTSKLTAPRLIYLRWTSQSSLNLNGPRPPLFSPPANGLDLLSACASSGPCVRVR